MAAAWIDTYDEGLFQPAYARFNGYSWRNASYFDTHSIDFELPYFRRLDFSKVYAESVSKVMIAPKRLNAGSSPDIHPIMVGGWIFNDEKFNGTELFYCDLNASGSNRRWYSISWSKSNKTDFDIYFDEDYIYATWLEWDDIDKCYQVMASRYSYDHHYWMPMENDNNNVLNSAKVTTTPGSKFTPKIASIPHGPSTTPIVCWEEDGDIHMAKWDPSTEPLPTPHIKRWVNLLGVENTTTNVSNTPYKESHDPDFAIDNTNNPIVVWGEENVYNRLGVVCSRWNGGSWWNYQSQPGFSSIGDTITEGDVVFQGLHY
ncbi:MAG: hypothetical protein R2883_00775 [Caldisericia bacterium]